MRILFSILLLTCMAAKDGGAEVSFDFEQQYWIEPEGNQCKDHSLLKEDGLYHVFYIQSFPPIGNEVIRQENWFGHITSPDLRHWTWVDSILSIDTPNPPYWENNSVWAPKIIEDPSGPGWILYYTGVNPEVSQQTGVAFSDDLYDWIRYAGNPVYHPGAWAQWDEVSWSNCRDPEIFHMDGDPTWYLLNTASAANGFGAVSLATSQDLLDWTDAGIFFLNDSENVLESVQLIYRNDHYHLFFTEQNDSGTSYLISPDFATGWVKEDRIHVDYARAAEVDQFGDENHFSRHFVYPHIDDDQFYLRFDDINFDTPDNVPVVEYVLGFTEDWTIVFGDAFDTQPTFGDNPRQRGHPSSGMEGNSYVGTYENFPHANFFPLGRVQGNVPVGMIQSDEFTIVADRMSLLVGGGDKPELCFVAMVSAYNHRILFWQTGYDSYTVYPELWNLETLLGEAVYMVVADLSGDQWGHISVDSIREYQHEPGEPGSPEDPLSDGPYLDEVLIAAGFDPITAVDEQAPPPRREGRLLPAHPNPFNPRTRLRYELERAGAAELLIFDEQGRRLRRLFAGTLAAGTGFFTWDGRDDGGRRVPSGFYIARLSLNGRSLGGQKLILLE